VNITMTAIKPRIMMMKQIFDVIRLYDLFTFTK
jgi:hypothetical protein